MGIKMGNAVKNCQKNGFKKKFGANRSFFDCERAKMRFALISLFIKERFAHGRSFLKSDKSESF